MNNYATHFPDSEEQTIPRLSMVHWKTTPNQKRFRRDLVIYLAHRGRVSQRILADVFDLARSRIGEIVQKHSAFDVKRERGDRGAPLFRMPMMCPGTNRLQRRRQLRDVIIKVAHRGGVSQRILADVFNLAHSRVAAIIGKSTDYYGAEEQGAR